MSLQLYKYEKWPTNKAINNNNDSIHDLVIAFEIGFDYQPKNNNHIFFKSLLFCFHYCIDIYKNKKAISFDILSPNENTNTYCFSKENNSFFNPKKFRKITIENINLNIPLTHFNFNFNNSNNFEEIICLLKKELEKDQSKIINYFNKQNISFDIQLDTFHKEVNSNFLKYVEITYNKLAQEIKEYNSLSLKINLENDLFKNKNNKNKLKI